MENKVETIQNLCNEINKATCNMLSYLKKCLIESGEREIRYYFKHYHITKIRYNDCIEIFDEDEEWLPLAELDTDTIVELITYIVW